MVINPFGLEMESSETLLLWHVIYAATGATLLEVVHIRSGVFRRFLGVPLALQAKPPTREVFTGSLQGCFNSKFKGSMSVSQSPKMGGKGLIGKSRVFGQCKWGYNNFQHDKITLAYSPSKLTSLITDHWISYMLSPSFCSSISPTLVFLVAGCWFPHSPPLLHYLLLLLRYAFNLFWSIS